jgi:hypothetical protein
MSSSIRAVLIPAPCKSCLTATYRPDTLGNFPGSQGLQVALRSGGERGLQRNGSLELLSASFTNEAGALRATQSGFVSRDLLDQIRNSVQHKLVGDVKPRSDALAIRGEDLRQLPLTMRKTTLAGLLRPAA